MAESVGLGEQIAGSTFEALDGEYAVVRPADAGCLGDPAVRQSCFAILNDGGLGEVTLIIRSAPGGGSPVAVEKGYAPFGPYRAIRFNLFAPFEGVGFIAALSGAIAAQGVNILAVSAYSCDYILVKSGDLDAALAALRGLGMEERK